MSYLGNPPAEAFTTTVKDSFDGDGSTTGFTMSQPSVTNDVRVVVENVVQDPTVAYTCAGTTLTFTSAPPAGTGNIYVVHLGPAIQTAQPPAEIANATSFLSSVTVQGAFTSLGIDDNATSTAMTLDTSGNLLVGTTSSTPHTGTSTGVAIRNDGGVFFTRANADVLNVNRTTSDGAIAQFRKDGTTVGSIGIESGGLTIDGEAGHAGLRFGGADISPRDGGADADNAIQLGSTVNRFTDLYLSGGVYLGGTGSANHLDDYEEGTWTPSLGGNAQYDIQEGYYVKVGGIVYITMGIRANVLGTGSTTQITGLPFSAAYSAGISPSYYDNAATNIYTLDGLLQVTSIYLYGRTSASNAASQTPAFFQNNARLYLSATYRTNA